MKPYNEELDPEKQWQKEYTDPFDCYLPSHGGLISDMVYHLRLTEVPTIFTVWSVLAAISGVLKREAWIQWMPGERFYSNIYVTLIGPPGLGKKSTIISKVGKLIEDIWQRIEDPYMAIRKVNAKIVKDKTTPEALIESITPTRQAFPKKYITGGHLVFGKDYIMMNRPDGTKLRYTIASKNGEIVKVPITSEVTILLSEMSTAISKQQYAEGMIDNLLDLYDPREFWHWRTVKRGTVEIRNSYVTFLGATTPDKFRHSIPKAALGDGFISRMIIAHQDINPRIFSRPSVPPAAPSEEELKNRMAWIAEHTVGEHTLTAEAEIIYDRWYRKYREYLENSPTAGSITRMGVNIFKVALLLKAQRYATDNIIEACDMQDAIRLIEGTYRHVPDFLLGLSDDTQFWRGLQTTMGYIQRNFEVTRAKLMQNKKLRATEVDQYINHLVQSGKVTIVRSDGEHRYPSSDGKEIYRWIETN